MSLFTHQKMTKKPGTKFRRSTGDFSKSFQFKNILTTKKWAVPAYIRGFDSFKPPMSRFCLWKAALFTRFWSLHLPFLAWLTRFWSLHLPFLAWLTRFWSRNFSQGDLIYEVLISGKTIYIYYIYNVYTRFWSRLRHSDGLLFARSWSHSVRFRPAPMHEVLISLLAWRRELIHEVCISPRCAEPPKRDQNLVNGVTLGEAGGGHQMWFTFIKKQQDIGNQIGRFLRKTLIFAGKEAEKTGVFRIREVEIHKKRWKVIILYRVYR